VRNNPLNFTDPTGMDAASDWVNSGSIEIQLQALAAVGWSTAQWGEWHHQQFVGALQYIGYQNAMAALWVNSQSIANGGAGDCDQACQWQAAARGYQSAAASVQGGGGGCRGLSFVCDAGRAVAGATVACAKSATCSGGVMVGSGIAITALSGGSLSGVGTVLVAAGTTRMAVADGQACAQGDGVSCGLAVLDVASIGSMGLYSKGVVYGVTKSPARRMLFTEVDNGTLVPADWVARTVIRNGIKAANATHTWNNESGASSTVVQFGIGAGVDMVRE
jgi:hypothetical protein